MRNYEVETTVENKADLQQVPKHHVGVPEVHDLFLPQRDPLKQVTCRVGDTLCANAHAYTPNRTTVGQPSRGAQSLLQLQRLYGNRYVQRVLTLARKAESETEVSSEVERAIQQARGGGRTLNGEVRAQMEPVFGVDFSSIRVHTDAEADRLNRALNARAFTTGQDIFFRQGEYHPSSSSGQELLAHELTHAVQQQGGQVQGELTIGKPGDTYEHEAGQLARAFIHQQHSRVHRRLDDRLVHRQIEEEERIQVVTMAQGTWVQRDPPVTQFVSTEEFDLAQQKAECHRLVDDWYGRYQRNLQRNAISARHANQRFIEFEEDAINELRIMGAVGSRAISLFGKQGGVVALCIIVLTEVAARGLSGKNAKVTAAVAALDERLSRAITETENRRNSFHNQIDAMTSAYAHSEWWRLFNSIANAGVPQIVSENIIYRDLLLEYARRGGYNISGSQWNVDNMSLFGRAPWYHSWDWGSPGWTNGQDIAAELNALAAAHPSTRISVSIN